MTFSLSEQQSKTLSEYGPLVGFFMSYWLYNLEIATAVLVVLTIAAVIFTRLTHGKFPLIPMITAGIVVLFGGLALVFDDPRFIKIKPTVVQTLLGLVLIISARIKRPLLAVIMNKQISFTQQNWCRLSYRYGLFFLAMALLNEYIWRNFSTDLWVNFKFFGLTGLTLIFSLSQIAFIMRHNIEKPDA